MVYYKLIADYPGNHLKVGELLRYSDGKFKAMTCFGFIAFSSKYLNKFPHLFERIETKGV